MAEGGILDEVTWDGTEDSICSNKTSSWRLYSAVHSLGSDVDEWNEITAGQSNRWRAVMAFSNRPESTYPEDQRNDGFDYRPSPGNFKYDVSIGADENVNDLFLTGEEPKDGDGGTDYDEYQLFIDILGGVGGFWTGTGATVVNYAINSLEGGASVDPSESSMSWDVPLDGSDYSDLPRERSSDATSSEVTFRVNSDYSSGTHNLSVTQSFTYDYWTALDPISGSCDYSDRYLTSRTSATTKSLTPEYDAVP